MGAGDAWEDEGYAGEDDWGEESIEADLEEELLEPGELEPEAEPEVAPGEALWPDELDD